MGGAFEVAPSSPSGCTGIVLDQVVVVVEQHL